MLTENSVLDSIMRYRYLAVGSATARVYYIDSSSLISNFFLIVSLRIFLDLPFLLLIWLTSLWSTLLTVAFTSRLTTCQNIQVYFLSDSLMMSLLVLFILVLSNIQPNILISSTFILFFVTSQTLLELSTDPHKSTQVFLTCFVLTCTFFEKFLRRSPI